MQFTNAFTFQQRLASIPFFLRQCFLHSLPSFLEEFMRNFSRGVPCQATHNTNFLACLHKIHNLAAFLKKRPNPPSSYSIKILRANIMICSCNILKLHHKYQ